MLHPETFQFLTALKKHNDRNWFEENRKKYEEAKKDVHQLVDTIIKRIPDFDKTLVGLEVKDCVFRINRDIRFSKDKSPYKTNMGAAFSKGGKNALVAGYYLHVEPDNSFAAGGFWMPPAPQLKAIRQEIAYNGPDFEKILKAASFKKYFKTLEGEKLKTTPKEYDKEHPYIAYLKYKSFVVSTPLKDAQLLNKKATDEIVSVFKSIQPLVAFLNTAVS
jgi:uncharacterized protein (TIGR02453 family)